MHDLLTSLAGALGITVETAYLLVGLIGGFAAGRIVRVKVTTADPTMAMYPQASVRTVTSMNGTIETPSGTFTFEGAELQEVRSLVQGGKMIEAIKLIREKTGLGLKEAKDVAEALRQARALH